MRSPGSYDPSISLLYVDDEPALLEVGKAFLESSNGIHVDTQETAIDALRELMIRSYDAIISDYQMPEMDGIAFLRALREKGDRTPFVIFTGKGREEVVIEAFEAGADFYIQKGGDPRSQFTELERKVRRAVELHRAENVIGESEERFQRVMSLVPDMISIHDPEMTILYSNWMGFGDVPKEKRVFQTKCYRTYRDCDEICPDCQAKEVLASKKPFQREVLLPDGRWIDLRVIPVLDAEGNVEFFMEWVQDISERKRSIFEISEAQRLLEGTLDGITDIIGLQRPDHTIIRYNKAGYDALNMTPEEVEGRRCYELIGRDEPCEICATTEAVATGKAVTIEKYIPELQKYFQCTSNPVFGDNGEVELIIERLHDISELKRTEVALRQSEEKYRTLVDRASQMLFLHDQHGAILDVNQKAIESTGYSREELLSMNVADIDPDVERREDKRWIWEGSPLLEERIFETRHRRKDGSIYPAEVHASKVTIAGEHCIMGLATDITSRKQEEAALRESEEKFRGIIDNLQDIYYRTDADGIVTMLSPSAAGVFGYDTPDAMMGKPASDFWAHPEERKEILRRIAEEGGVQDYEVTLKKADRSFLPVSVSCRQIYDSSGDPAGIEGIVRDITRRKEAEEALRESEEKYRLIAENSADNLWIFDMDFSLRYISPSVLKMKGFTEEEALAQAVDEMMTPASYAALLDRFHEEMEREASGTADPDRVVSFETEEYCRDGTTILVENSARLIRDEDGTPVRILGISRDITKRKEMERAIQSQLDLIEGLFDGLPIGVVIMDPGGAINLMNREVEAITGYTPEELRRIEDWFLRAYPDPAYRDEVLSIWKSDKAEKVRSREFKVTCKDGTVKDIEFHGAFLADGRIIVAISDVTERKGAEEALRESEEKYRLIADNTADTIWIADLNLNIQYISPSVLKMRGYTPEEVMGQPLHEMLTPASFESVQKRFAEEMAREATGTADPDRTIPIEFEKYRKDGTTIQVENAVRFLRDPDGRPTGIIGVSRDITERRKMERVLKSQLDLIEGIFRNLPVGVSIVDENGTALLMNSEYERITGYSPDEIPTVNEWFLRAYPDPAYRDEVLSILDNDRKGTVTTREFKVTCKDGTVKDIEFHEVYLADGRTIVTISDVTERKEAEEALRQSEAEKGALLNAIPVMLAYYDTNLNLLYANKVSGDSVGEKPEDLAGRHCYEIWHNRTEPCQDCPVLRSLATGKIEEGEVTVPDGRTFFIRGCPIYDTEGEIRGLIEFGMDISELKRADFIISAAQLRLKEAHRLANIGVWDWVEATDTMNWSEELYAIAGRDPALPALNYEEHEPLYTPASWDRLKDAIHATLRTGEPFRLELEMVRPDGTIRNVHALGRQNLDINGNCIGLHGAVQDITDMKQAEEALRTANKKLQILSGITRHDIQNKIMVLQAYLDLTRPEIDDPKLSNYLNEVDRAGSEIQRQIEFTRTYEELGMKRPDWYSLEDLLSPISRSELPLHLDCSGYRVLADPMIEKVFENLMDNTIRHAEGASQVEIRCEERDGDLAILWQDDGPGIPIDQKEQIFRRGYGENTGLGLFLSQEILAITGITIKETGVYGKGARFEILVPVGAWKKNTGDT